jgi:hypothetical protein
LKSETVETTTKLMDPKTLVGQVILFSNGRQYLCTGCVRHKVECLEEPMLLIDLIRCGAIGYRRIGVNIVGQHSKFEVQT